jgi:hypothetical protein
MKGLSKNWPMWQRVIELTGTHEIVNMGPSCSTVPWSAEQITRVLAKSMGWSHEHDYGAWLLAGELNDARVFVIAATYDTDYSPPQWVRVQIVVSARSPEGIEAIYNALSPYNRTRLGIYQTDGEHVEAAVSAICAHNRRISADHGIDRHGDICSGKGQISMRDGVYEFRYGGADALIYASTDKERFAEYVALWLMRMKLSQRLGLIVLNDRLGKPAR